MSSLDLHGTFKCQECLFFTGTYFSSQFVSPDGPAAVRTKPLLMGDLLIPLLVAALGASIEYHLLVLVFNFVFQYLFLFVCPSLFSYSNCCLFTLFFQRSGVVVSSFCELCYHLCLSTQLLVFSFSNFGFGKLLQDSNSAIFFCSRWLRVQQCLFALQS